LSRTKTRASGGQWRYWSPPSRQRGLGLVFGGRRGFLVSSLGQQQNVLCINKKKNVNRTPTSRWLRSTATPPRASLLCWTATVVARRPRSARQHWQRCVRSFCVCFCRVPTFCVCAELPSSTGRAPERARGYQPLVQVDGRGAQGFCNHLSWLHVCCCLCPGRTRQDCMWLLFLSLCVLTPRPSCPS